MYTRQGQCYVLVLRNNFLVRTHRFYKNSVCDGLDDIDLKIFKINATKLHQESPYPGVRSIILSNSESSLGLNFCIKESCVQTDIQTDRRRSIAAVVACGIQDVSHT